MNSINFWEIKLSKRIVFDVCQFEWLFSLFPSLLKWVSSCTPLEVDDLCVGWMLFGLTSGLHSLHKGSEGRLQQKWDQYENNTKDHKYSMNSRDSGCSELFIVFLDVLKCYQTASANICERIVCSQELSEIQCGTTCASPAVKFPP